ncbi:MAG: hypothetical protein CFH19_00103 [Alphaproteobacteria bacterium MarineAlpha5_Bin9]|nr:MAG: hypothetical protein CFH19_00103 [Alphaproteobacteria bacterium MarineAlpha5_Bin9]|tara:strand:- start:21505 stop:22353 length:849 start_codon:yes stop_codon:yes gene_type:complete
MGQANKKIFWISSYPKSGNTWLRAIITSLFFTNDGKFFFEILKHISNFEIKKNYEFVKSLNFEDYMKLNKLNIISKYWLEAQNKLDNNIEFNFFKTHSANISYNENNFTNTNNAKGLIYILRDPRDIALSYSKHLGKDLDQIIDFMIDESSIIRTSDGYPSFISRWDYNYLSWKNIKIPKLFIKYEDMLDNNEKIIKKIICFFEENYNYKFYNVEKKIKNILLTTNFEKLQENEKKYGFIEAEHNLFFNQGKKGQWLKSLTLAQKNKIESTFINTMKDLNYL